MLREEMELHISMSAVDKTASIFTSDPVWIRRLDKLCREHPGNYREVVERRGIIDGQVVTKQYVCTDKGLIGLRGKRPEGRTLTEEEKQALAERLAAMRQKQAEKREEGGE